MGIILQVTWILFIGIINSEQPCPKHCACEFLTGKAVLMDCSLNNLQSFAEDVHFFKNVDVVRLNLSFNSFSEQKVPPIPSLRNLDLSHNGIKTISENFHTKFANLQILNISHNAIDVLPKNFPKHLKVLTLSHNRIKLLDLQLLTSLVFLQALYLDFNLIKSLGSFTTKAQTFQNLEIITLRGNRLESFSKDFRIALKNVQKLSLCNNSLTYISNETFLDFHKIIYLDLSHNDLYNIEDQAFIKLRKLKYIFLANNSLGTFPSGLPMLEWLDVSYNKITSISELQSSDIFPQELFLIGGNPFHCDCRLLWLKEYYHTREFLKSYRTIDMDKFVPVCASPIELAGSSWDMLEDAAFGCDENSAETASKSQDFLEDSSDVQTWRISDLFIKIKEVGDTYIHIIWNSLASKKDISKKVVFFSIHPFGKKHLQRNVLLEIFLEKYIVKDLEPHTPYILCISLVQADDTKLHSSSEILMDSCHEIVTMETPVKLLYSVIFYVSLFVISFIFVYYFRILVLNLHILFSFVRFINKDSLQVTKADAKPTTKSILKNKS